MAGARGLGGGRVFADLPELETERLLLRKMRLDDAEAMFAYASLVGARRRASENREVVWPWIDAARNAR